MGESVAEKNIELWSSYQPKAAVMLSYVDPVEVPLPKIPVQTDADVLFVYGLAEVEFEGELVFLENDLGRIRALLESTHGSKLLKKAKLYYLGDPNTFESLYWDYLQKKVEVIGPNKNEFEQKLIYELEIRNTAIKEYLQYGARFFFNYYKNLRKLPEAYKGHKLFGKYKKVPAIICGAGPSLNKNIDQLKNRDALIFAGGSALKALDAKGIVPDFGAGIDPNNPQLDRLKSVQHLEMPFFYRNRILPEALDLVSGPKLFLTGSGGYDIAPWFEKELDIEAPPIREGHNVVNFMLEIAHAMGCDPIIFVGMDLGYTGNKLYATGVDEKAETSQKVLRKDIYGNDLYTEWKWITESNWISDFAKNHEVTLINATEGGLGFPDVPNQDLDQIKFSNKVKVDQNLEPLNVTSEQVESAITKMQESLKRCLEHLEVLINDPDSGFAALAEVELSEEHAYTHILEVFNSVYKKLNRQSSLQFLKNVALANLKLINGF